MVPALNTELGGHAYNKADRAVINNKEAIKSAAEQYNVDANVLAACIYVEQYYNYNLIDDITDVSLFFMDTSVGLAQVKISTAKLLMERGYVQTYGNGSLQNLRIAKMLKSDNVYNIQCAAAYLSYLESYWDTAYDVSADPTIWGTLYNMGPLTPHGNPKPNWFGEKVGGYYWYMERLLN